MEGVHELVKLRKPLEVFGVGKIIAVENSPDAIMEALIIGARVRDPEPQMEETMSAKVEDKAVAGPKETKAPKPKVEKVRPQCGCGCGVQTGGGRFLPGHDAKLKSALISAIENGTDAEAENARGRLRENNWSHFGTKADERRAKRLAKATAASASEDTASADEDEDESEDYEDDDES